MRGFKKHYTWWMWGVAALLMAAGPAPAFYWRGWPGSGVPTPPNLVPPTDQEFPPPEERPPTDRPPDRPPEKPPYKPPTEHVPEPGTGLIGLVGLGALTVRRWQRMKRGA